MFFNWTLRSFAFNYSYMNQLCSTLIDLNYHSELTYLIVWLFDLRTVKTCNKLLTTEHGFRLNSMAPDDASFYQLRCNFFTVSFFPVFSSDIRYREWQTMMNCCFRNPSTNWYLPSFSSMISVLRKMMFNKPRQLKINFRRRLWDLALPCQVNLKVLYGSKLHSSWSYVLTKWPNNWLVLDMCSIAGAVKYVLES